MKCGVVVFPGSNCDHDVYHVLRHVLDQETEFLWHQSTDLGGCEFIVVPGGFSYGDYLRAGSMAALSPVMAAIQRHADAGGLVLGICNGFQILLEAGLLPGAMRRNRSLRFISRDVLLRVERNDLPFTSGYRQGQVVRMPVAHAEGNYVDTEEALDRLERNGQVIFRYCGPDGSLDPDANADAGVANVDADVANVNGSERSIAGICSAGGNVAALMPHPERCAEDLLHNRDGLDLFAAVVGSSVGALAGAGR